jgi:hypothetical protein
VHAVPREGGDLELRGVRIRDLGRVGEASGGRISAPTPADAEAAAEHARELEAARMRVARLRDQQSAADPDGTDTHTADNATTDTATADALRADGGGVGGLDADRRSAAGGNDDGSNPTSGTADAATARPADLTEDLTDGDGTTGRS